MMVEELSKGKLKELTYQFDFAEAIEHPERFKEIGLDPSKADEIRKKLLTLSLEILSEGKIEERGLIRSCIRILGRCGVEDKELHDSIIDCLIGYMNRDSTFAMEATESLERLTDITSPEMWGSQNRTEHLARLIETGNDMSSWNGVYAVARLAPKMDKKALQSQVSVILSIEKSSTGIRVANAVSALGKLYQYSDSKEEILDMLLLSAQNPNDNIRRASIFALEDCISDGTKDKILSLFEALLEDEAKTVKYGALEALTEVLPYKISDKAFDKMLRFLEADEPWIRWRAVLAIGKAYPELNPSSKERAVRVLTALTRDGDVFVKVRAYEAFLNIKDLEKLDFLEVDEALSKESDFVRQWVLYNFDLRDYPDEGD